MLVRKERPDPQKSLVGFVVGDILYAVAIGAVREIINPAPLTALPHLPPAIAGVTDHRGDVIPIVDLRARFGMAPEVQRKEKWILVNVGDRRVGLVVDSVTEVFGTSGEQLRPPPEVGGDEASRGIAGVTTHEGRLVFVLALERLEDLLSILPENGLEGIGG